MTPRAEIEKYANAYLETLKQVGPIYPRIVEINEEDQSILIELEPIPVITFTVKITSEAGKAAAAELFPVEEAS